MIRCKVLTPSQRFDPKMAIKSRAGNIRTSITHSAASLDEYLKIVNRESDSDALPPSVFRGQREDLPLLPKLARLYNKRRLKGEFREVEREMLSQFKRQAAIYTQANLTDWDWLALAQHHGMATRLLDWSENPLLALWFAVRKEPNKDKNGVPIDGVVWIFSPSSQSYIDTSRSTSPFALTSTKVLLPGHSNTRLRVQSGRFTVHHFIEDKNRFVPLDRHNTYKKYLKKIVIPSKEFQQLRCDLDRCGINSGTMFPDLSGLAEHVEWQHTLLDDEI